MKRSIFLFLYLFPFLFFAESFVSIEGYPETKELMKDYADVVQTSVIENTKIGNILYPTFGFAALVSESDPSFSVLLKSEKEPADVTLSIGEEVDGEFIPIMKMDPENIEPAGEDIYKLSFFTPVILPRFLYSIKIENSSGESWFSRNSIAFYDEKRLEFTIFADPQIEDVTAKKTRKANWNNREYPFYSGSFIDFSRQVGAIKIFVSQLNHSTSNFTVCLGDLVNGVDHQREYDSITELLRDIEVPFFAIPGNHDGYAKFEDQEDFSTPLERDGLNYWRTFLGPLYFSFKANDKLFIMLNTYDGNADRRASGKPVGIGDNSIPPVSNYGGFLPEMQLEWAEKSIKESDDLFAIFSHHLPLGNLELDKEYRFHGMQQFPEDSILGNGGFEEWNYEALYDSDLSDNIFSETLAKNTGVTLASYIADAKATPYYFSGHTHLDRVNFYEAGEELVTDSGLYATDDIYFVQTTAASSEIFHYWGVREIKEKSDKLEFNYICETGAQCYPNSESEAEKGFQSIPLGNFWITYSWGDHKSSIYSGGDGKSRNVTAEVTNYLPTEKEVVLRFKLLANGKGFKLDNENFEITDSMLSRDKMLNLITVKGTVDAGSSLEEFYERIFTKTSETVTISPGEKSAPEPIVEYLSAISENEELFFEVKNSENYLHLIWINKKQYLSDGSILKMKFDNYDKTERVKLLYIDKNGAHGISDFAVTITEEIIDSDRDSPDVEQTDSENVENEIDTKNDQISPDSDSSEEPFRNDDACSCSVII